MRLDHIYQLLSAQLSALNTAMRVMIFSTVTLAIAGCGGMDVGGLFSDSGPEVQTQVPEGTVVEAKVALLLPLGADGEIGQIGKAMKQAAELALFDAGQSGITLITKDTGGTPEGAQAAAQAALGEGAQLVLGPLLSSEVKTVSPIASGRNVPVIAFSSVGGVAGQGTYLMSFLPQEEIANIVRHSTGAGLRNIAALVPNSQYGATVQAALEESAKTYGANIVMVERYARTVAGLAGPAKRIAQAASDPGRQVQAVLLPEGGQLLNEAGTQLTQSGLSTASIRILGTGLWDDPATANIPIAGGGWFAGISSDGLKQFQRRFETTYSSKPHRLASLAYDATSLAIILARGTTPDRFANQQITNPEGFQGVNGLFRFRQNGLIQRGLSILEVAPGGNRIVAPAPTRFGNGF